MTGVLELHDVSVYYGDRPALQSVSLSLAHGSQAAVIGPNGAGKSTLFKAIVGLVPMRTGKILIHGRPLGCPPRSGGIRAAEGGGRLALPGDRVRRGGHGSVRPGALAQAALGHRQEARPREPGTPGYRRSGQAAHRRAVRAVSSRGRSLPGRWCRSRTCFFSTSLSPGWIWPRARPLWSLVAGSARPLGNSPGLHARSRPGLREVRRGDPAERPAHQRREPRAGLHRAAPAAGVRRADDGGGR